MKRLLVFCLLLAACAHEPRPRNILFIAVDDLRPELGTYGASWVKSPHLDRLAAGGRRFDRAYTQYPICGPSRASLLTGLRPDTLKIEHIDTFFRDTVPGVVTLPQHFKQHGYQSVYVGKVFHPRQEDDARSWTRQLPVASVAGEYKLAESQAILKKRRAETGIAAGPAWENATEPDAAYQDGRIADRAVAALRELGDRPFFLGVGFHKPHLPFVCPKRYADLYDPAQIPLAEVTGVPQDGPTIARHGSFELRVRTGVPVVGLIDEDTSRKLRHAYAGCVSFVDAQIGRVIDGLEALGLRQNTVIVVWGDHGWHLGEYGLWGKATNHEVATRVPLIVWTPDLAAPGRGSRALVEFVDIYPTLVDLAGLPMPPHLEGTSFVPLLAEPDRPWKKAAFSQFPSPALREWAAKPLSPAMRKYFTPHIQDVEAQLKAEHGSRYDAEIFDRHLMGYSLRTDRYRFTAWVDRRHPEAEPFAVELYDHEADPHEATNVARDRPVVVSELRRQLSAGWKAAQPR